MTIVRLRLAGAGSGTSRSTVRLHGLVPREWFRLRVPTRPPRAASGEAFPERRSRIPTVAGRDGNADPPDKNEKIEVET